MSGDAPLPLQGVRVLTVSSFGAGPWGTMLLGDLGAEVIKIEDRRSGGDAARGVPPLDERAPDDSLYFQSMNRNKRSLTLDIRSDAGRAILRDLARVSDAVYNNLRGDLPGALGLDYAALSEVNPRLVCVSCSGFGRGGERAGEPGYDFVIQALAGYMSLTGEPGGPPVRSGVSVVDFATGLVSVVGLLSGLLRARETGRGGDVETSLLQGGVSMLNYLAAWNLNLGVEPRRIAHSAHQSVAPVQIFATSDGWIFVMCMKDKFFERMCARLGREDLAADPRYASITARGERREELVETLAREFARGTTAHWLERLRGEVPCAPVNDLTQALSEPQLQQLGMLWELEHPKLGSLREVGCPIDLPGSEAMPRRPAPALGADTEDLLSELLGLSSAEIEKLRTDGVI